MIRILVVDDQRNMRAHLGLMLRGEGYEVDEAESGQQGVDLGTKGAYDLVITDLRMDAVGGLGVLRAVREAQAMTEVIVMSAYGTIENAVEAMRIGAFDFIQKPFTEDEFLFKVRKSLENRRLVAQVQAFASEFRERYGFENIVGRSQAIRDVLARIVKVAPTDATVLITGESGTGKELVAKAIHANSRRSDRPFIPVNCAAIAETVLQSELFGHARGAFTGATTSRKGLFEEADGGTFFFDEIAETTVSFQAKLLRAIQEGEIRRVGENKSIRVDVRIVAATNQDLAGAIATKRFREDLYYRLNVARFQLPPLRDRREDIPVLTEFFLDKYNRKLHTHARLAEGALDALVAYDYPGNVRELENMIEQAVALCDGASIEPDELVPRAAKSRRPHSGTHSSLTLAVDEVEREVITATLEKWGGNREKAAEELDISVTTLWRKMTRLGIRSERQTPPAASSDDSG